MQPPLRSLDSSEIQDYVVSLSNHHAENFKPFFLYLLKNPSQHPLECKVIRNGTEQTLNLLETQEFWSALRLYNKTGVTVRFDNINKFITLNLDDEAVSISLEDSILYSAFGNSTFFRKRFLDLHGRDNEIGVMRLLILMGNAHNNPEHLERLISTASINGYEVSAVDFILAHRKIKSSVFKQYLKQSVKSILITVETFFISSSIFWSLSAALGEATSVSLSWAIADALITTLDIFDINTEIFGNEYSKTSACCASFMRSMIGGMFSIPLSYMAEHFAVEAFGKTIITNDLYQLYMSCSILLIYALVSAAMTRKSYELCNTAIETVQGYIQHAPTLKPISDKITSVSDSLSSFTANVSIARFSQALFY